MLRTFIMIGLALVSATTIGAQAAVNPGVTSGLASPPSINARAAVVMDARTGTILYAKNPDLALPPASLTKLVTLHLAMKEIAAGRLSLDEMIEIDPRDCSPRIPYGSSIMYLYPGMKVSVRDLMLGAAVVSGNDAAYSLARRISGSNEEFAKLMNEEVKEMGFDGITFIEPSGLSERNLISARQFALFCKKYIELHPDALRDLHSIRSIEFPRAEHSAPGYTPSGRIVQYNRNPLVFNYPGADGLKTGYIIEVGFNMAATAEREGTRYIVITLGGTGASYAGGGQQRTRDVGILMDWAFGNFETVSIDPGPLPELRSWYGAKRRVKIGFAGTNAVTIPKSQKAELVLKLEIPPSVDAPISVGKRIGRAVYYLGSRDIHTIDIMAIENIKRGFILRRLFDGFLRFFVNLFGKR
jgi:D-alanyl-D-alanine carboxypeptidase (penicillin-binding protein 5/6)